MPPKGSGSQSSTLVSRGGTSGTAAPRAPAGAVAPRRRSSKISNVIKFVGPRLHPNTLSRVEYKYIIDANDDQSVRSTF
jgi:hypothetical protein